MDKQQLLKNNLNLNIFIIKINTLKINYPILFETQKTYYYKIFNLNYSISFIY